MRSLYCIFACLGLVACSYTDHHPSYLNDSQVECYVATNHVLLKVVDVEPERTKADYLIQIQPDDTAVISHYLRSMKKQQYVEYGAMNYAEVVEFLEPHPENLSFEITSGSNIISEEFFDDLLGAIVTHGFSSLEASGKIGAENVKVICLTSSSQAAVERE